MRSARVFRNVDCLDAFDPTALYVLSSKNVRAARFEAIQRAWAGEQITKALAESIVDRHRSLPEATNDLRRACHALRRGKARLKLLEPAEAAPLSCHLARLRDCWEKLDAVLSANEETGKEFKPPGCTDHMLKTP
jgi:hypothetical protein